MKSSQKRYLDKIVDTLVKESIIQYERGYVKTPLFSSPFDHLLNTDNVYPSILTHPFFSYLIVPYYKDTYGLVNDEIEYVWSDYKRIMREKIDNGR
jgi:hypothetical protein